MRRTRHAQPAGWLRLLALAAVAAILTACGEQPAEPPTATPEPPTITPPSRPTLPPSWTPGPPPTRPPPGAESAPPTATQPGPLPQEGRPTLPPSWTPGAFATVTRPADAGVAPTRPPPTITPVARATLPIGVLGGIRGPGGPPTIDPTARFDPACAALARRSGTSVSFEPNTAARIVWSGVEGADGYRVWVLNPSMRYAFDQVTDETSITIPAGVFVGTGLYAWEVMPMRDGDRMCQSLTGVFTLRRD
jgi:hypothetical protein